MISSPPALLGLIIFRENEAGKLVDKVPPSSDGEIYKKRKFWSSLYNQKWIFSFPEDDALTDDCISHLKFGC